MAVQLPPNTTPAGNARSYLMALTLEDAQGDFEMPNLTGINPFPNDNTAAGDRRRRSAVTPRPNGWYTTKPRITITGTDDGRTRSGVEQIQYRINGGTPQLYSGPFDLTAEGEITLEFRAVDRAGNAETFDGVDLKVDPNAPTTLATTYPGPVLEGGWHDREVTVSLRAGDGQGSGTDDHRVPRQRLRADDDEGGCPTRGRSRSPRRARTSSSTARTDVAGNVEDDQGSSSVLVDVTAPVTASRINGAEPVADYTSAVRIAFTRTDEPGLGTVETEYRVGDGDWTAYEGAFDIADFGGYRVDFRSIDLAGNVENYQTVTFAIRRAARRRRRRRRRRADVQPQAAPAPAPRAFAALEEPASKVRTLSALRGGQFKFNVSCQGVDARDGHADRRARGGPQAQAQVGHPRQEGAPVRRRGPGDGVAAAFGRRAQGPCAFEDIGEGEVDAAHDRRGR